MKCVGGSIQLSATDLVGYLHCHHLSGLDRAVATGALKKPKVWDPFLDILSERGSIHEKNYVDHLVKAGLDVVQISGVEVSDEAVRQTRAAMQRGTPVIVQAALTSGGWNGRADILRRVEVPSALGAWSYEPYDTKLSRETKAAAILQLCLYCDLLGESQGLVPEYMHVVVPWSNFEPQRYRYPDYAAYFRKVKQALMAEMASAGSQTYPDPVEHCEICRWRDDCDARRRADDHLCLVAGISKIQINELKAHGIAKVEDLARMPLPLDWKPDRGAPDSYVRIREQARIVVEARAAGAVKFELLPVVQGFGLTRLPEPCKGDIFFDLEGDPFAGEHGLEYLFGHISTVEDGTLAYEGQWAFSPAEEKRAFEQFVDVVMARWAKYPDLHIYHYAPYEPAALKRLMGRYATREEEVDQMLRGGLFVDLYQIVRHSLRASVESYSIKRLEQFYSYERDVPLAKVTAAALNLQASIELDDVASISDDAKTIMLGYNRDDCRSALGLRDWLEQLRATLVAQGTNVPRPPPGDGTATARVTDWAIKINALIERLTPGIPDDPRERTREQQARWILANILDWHRREDKAAWWEYFRLAELSSEDLLDERAGLSGLVFVGSVGGTFRAPVHRYRFPVQETSLRESDKNLRMVGGREFGTIEAIEFGTNTIDIKKRQDTVNVHPDAVFVHDHVNAQVMADALVRIGEYVASHGLLGAGPNQAAGDLLLKEGPRVGGQPLIRESEAPVQAAVRLCAHLAGGIVPVQGPPGAGKTYTGAQMICELVRLGKKVGITANSHKVVRNLIDAVLKAAEDLGVRVQCYQKTEETERTHPRLSFAKDNKDLFAALRSPGTVGGGTAWVWSRPDAFETVDVLFVDEAAQMSLANVLAVSQAAKTVVLLGDPQQLDQPTKGTHPDGTGVSALEHILEGARTIAPNKGLFLEETWRLHPSICEYTSEIFYDGKLRSRAGLENQAIKGGGPITRSGVHFIPVVHAGNQSCSREEADAVRDLFRAIIASKTSWVDREGVERLITPADIVIITPYNAQVFEIQERLPEARVGTVDKFQGQEAPIAIYSMATSTPADAPRGMEFLYSLNRLNVATSRAKCASVVVASPQLFEATCRTPRQIQLTNALCRYLEIEKEQAAAAR